MESVACVRESEGRGKGLFTVRHVKAGETIVAEKPLLLVVADCCKLHVCTNCLKCLSSKGLNLCANCNEACFCSLECSNNAKAPRGLHDDVTCQCLKNSNWEALSGESQDTLRYLIQMHALKCASAHNPDALRRFSSILELFGDGVGIDSSIVDDLHKRLSQAIDGESELIFSKEEVAALIHKEQANSYGVGLSRELGLDAFAGKEGEVLRGSAFYSTASRVNHECIPNVARCDDFDREDNPESTWMIFKALHDLPPDTEIFQSYFPLDWDYEERQNQCKNVYGFDCICPRCKIEEMYSSEEDDPPEPAGEDGDGVNQTYIQLFLLKYVCQDDECDGTMLPKLESGIFECNKCGAAMTEQEFLDSLEDPMDMDE